MIIGALSLLLITTIILFYVYITRHFSYWKNKGVPYLKPLPLLGNVQDLVFLRVSLGQQLASLHEKFRGHKFGGFFFLTRPCLLVRDPELIKHILVNDFEHFADPSFGLDNHGDPMFSNALFFMKGKRWKFYKEKITPIFTLARAKANFASIYNSAKLILGDIKQHRDSKGHIDVKEISESYPMNVICEYAFGVNGAKLLRGSGLLELAKDCSRPHLKRIFAGFVLFYLSGITRKIGISVIEDNVKETYSEVVRSIMRTRAETGNNRKDLVDLVTRLKEEYESSNNNSERKMILDTDVDVSESVLLGLLAGMFLAGYETTGNTLAFAFYELAKNEDFQKVLRQEIDDYTRKCNGEITYEGVQNLTELDKVVSEVVRMYSAVNFLSKNCTKEYTIPGTNVIIERGTTVYISLHGIHRDYDYFPDPEKFDPERFSEENKKNIKGFTYMPFGVGPRMCVGRPLALLELKIALLYIISYFELHTCSKTPMNIGLHPQGISAAPDKPVWLRVVDRNASIKPNGKTI